MHASFVRPLLSTVILLPIAFSACDCSEGGLGNTAPKLEVTPLMLDFGKVPRGDLRVLSLTLNNSGLSALSFTDFTISSTSTELGFGSATPADLGPNANTTVTVIYEPLDVGIDTGTIRIEADTGQEAFIVTLKGEGVEGGATVRTGTELCNGQEGSLSFGRSRPGNTVEKPLTVVASGTSPITVLSAVLEPGSATEFSIDGSALPRTLQPGEELVLAARYTPVDGGADQGAFVITTDAPRSPSIRVPICGEGIAPAICARPSPLDLGSIPEGMSNTEQLTIESCGLEPLTITRIVTSTDANFLTDPAFALSNIPMVPQTLAPGATITVGVTFTAATPFGAKRGFVAVNSNALGVPRSHFEINARTATPCGLSVVPLAVSFFNVMSGATAQKRVMIMNEGGTDCSVARVAVSMGSTEFSLVMPPAVPFTVAAGSSVFLDVNYAPQNAGPHNGVLEVEEAGGGVTQVQLLGNPPIPDECTVDISPTVVSFGVTGTGLTARQGVLVQNISGEACRITGVRLLGANTGFAATAPGLGFLVPNVGRATIDVAFTPMRVGPHQDTLEITVAGIGGGAGGGTFLVGVFGTAGESRLCVMPLDVRFGAVASGMNVERDVMINSCGTSPVQLRGVLMGSGSAREFSIVQTPNVPQTLAAGASAAPVLRVRYSPTSAGPHFGEIEVLSNDRASPITRVLLSGNWDEMCTKILQCTPQAIAFGDTDTERPKLVRVVCRNAGPSPVNISASNLTGGGGTLGVQGGGAATLPPGGAYAVDVWFDPAAAGPITGSLTIASDACIGPAAIPITGNGVVVPLPPCTPPSTFQPVLAWEWTGSTVEPMSRNVWVTPIVANLTDDNSDGRVDENDVPEVLFTSYITNNFTDPNQSEPGVLRVVSGDTGIERFSVANPNLPDSSQLAVGDLDGDGFPEIVAFKWFETPPGTGAGGILGRYTTGTLIGLDRAGRLLWESEPFSWPSEVTWNAAGISLADLDGNGFSEIIVGKDVFDHRGHLIWRGSGDGGYVLGGPQSIVADINNDGRPEVIAGGTVYNADGTIRWDVPDNFEGGAAVGRLDPTDNFPQIALQTNQLTVYDHLGVEQWSAPIPTMGPATQLPTIADFDGDGDGDIAVADGEGVHVFRGTGGLMWSAPVQDMTCCPGISAFDFEGDGTFELLLNDFGFIYIYRGATGQLLYTATRPSQTNLEMPIMADIDRDNKGELIVALQGATGMGGVRAYSNAGDTWVNAPPIWNQQSFYVDNVTASGAIPRVLPPLQGNSVFRGTTARCR